MSPDAKRKGLPARVQETGRSRIPTQRLAHIAVWAVVAAVVFALLGSTLPSGLGLTPAFAATSSLAKAKADLAQAKKDLKALQAKLDKLAKQQADADSDLESTKIRIDEVQARIGVAENDLAGLRAQLEGRLAEMYKNRGSDPAMTFLNVLFAGDDTSLTAIVDRLTMVTHIAQADQNLVDSVVGRVHELKTLKADLSAQKAVEAKKTAKYEAARDKTLNSLENSKDDYNALRKRVATLQEEARKREEEARRAEAARKAAAAAAAAAAEKKTTGTTTHRTTTTTESRPPVVADFVFPVDGPNSFSNTFGAPRSGGRTHQGCDIMTARNTPLLAVVDGVITSTVPYNTGLGGITIHLRGGNGTVYYYAHLSSIKDGIRAGVRVSAGQVIGYAGNTGNASGGAVHLHFEIRPNGGSAINPYPTLIKYR
jgi:peptidoglycan LD-endopeptidase LytH